MEVCVNQANGSLALDAEVLVEVPAFEAAGLDDPAADGDADDAVGLTVAVLGVIVAGIGWPVRMFTWGPESPVYCCGAAFGALHWNPPPATVL
jgi:hypothetical protein